MLSNVGNQYSTSLLKIEGSLQRLSEQSDIKAHHSQDKEVASKKAAAPFTKSLHARKSAVHIKDYVVVNIADEAAKNSPMKITASNLFEKTK